MDQAVLSLANAAARLGRRARRRKGARRPLPSLFFFTDPARTLDPAAALHRLPPGAAVVYRAFGAPDALAVGRRLRAIARARRLVFLVGADARLAAQLKADGVHLPERGQPAARRLRYAHPAWLITSGAHGPRILARAGAVGLDAAMLSSVFASNSASAGAPLGPLRFARLVRGARTPVIALGGVDARTVKRLAASGAAGVAAVSAIGA